ncbi:RDD family protein [Candidatus Poriferisocius sp.]|uniref:RDD family protein n=1 Tax=Candidatus Poriferisocius sp. TaxID=3101276 RepID=UPI003B0156E9
MSNPAWLPDPTGRHQYRWWDGERWTHHGADDGVATSDPVTGLDALPTPSDPQAAEAGQFHFGGRMAEFGDGRSVTLASPGARLGAKLIDSFLVSTPLAFPAFFTTEGDINWGDFAGIFVTSPTVEDWIFFGVVLFISFVYEVAFTATKGQTLGKMAAGIKMVGIKDGSIPGVGMALRRWSIPSLLGLVPFAGLILAPLCFLALTWHRDRRGWHDLAAGTMVVKVNRAASPKAAWARTRTGQPVLLATPGARLGARMIDFLVMSFFWLALIFPIGFALDALDFWDDQSWPGTAIYWLIVAPVFIVGLLYEVTMISAGGRTLGKMATGIHVIRKDTGGRPGPSRSIRRWVIPGLLLLIPFVGWLATLFCRLSLTWGKERQGWHDKVGGTLVVVRQSRQPTTGLASVELPAHG